MHPQEMNFATPGQDASNMGMGMQMSMTGGDQNTEGDSAAHHKEMPTYTAMKMKGLPFSVTREDIISFFQGCNLL